MTAMFEERAIPTWQDRLGIPNHCKPNTGEEAAMCGEIADLHAALARVVAANGWVNSKVSPPQPGLIVKRWNSGAVWAGIFNGDTKMASCDWWMPLPRGAGA